MAQYMNRTPNPPGASNFDTPAGRPVQFYEQRYETIGPQEWIYAPDAGPMYVTIFPVGSSSAFLEGTDEPPADAGGTATIVANRSLYGSTHYYPITDTVTDITRTEVRGCTAVRVNVLGGAVDVTVRV